LNYRNQSYLGINTYGGSGSIWEERFKTNLAQDDRYLLTFMRYIELNPVRADMVTRPEQYQWSIFHRNGRGEKDAVVMSHSLYHTLGRTIDLRQAACVELFRAHVDDFDSSEIRNAWQTGTPLGNDYFRQKVKSKLGCKVGQSRPSRPKLKPN
jgi:putative transposase